MISRLVGHKGVDLLKGVIDELLCENVQLVILGKGEKQYEEFFKNVQEEYSNKARAVIAYNKDLSSKIYSGADIFLMPSKMEPCGLSQMIASRYGTVPIVRETGGLNGSIKPCTGDSGNGFTFHNYNAHDMLYVINEAVRTFHDKEKWKDVQNSAITTDFSWKYQAGEYEKMYNK
jgi:starch synthase